MRASIDQSKCETAGLCVKICPEVFTFQPGSKKAVAKLLLVPEELEEKCREAAAQCPVNAVKLIEDSL